MVAFPQDILGLLYLFNELETDRVGQSKPHSSSKCLKWLPILNVLPLSDTWQSCIGLSHICVVLQMLLRGGARASPRVALDKTVGQKRKWKCHVNVFVMQ